MSTHTYQAAVAAVRGHSEAEQARLDALAAEARAKDVAAHRAAATAGLEPGTPAYAVGALVAQTLTIGRSDGYPEVAVPAETRAVMVAAGAAGVLPSCRFRDHLAVGGLEFHADGSGLRRDLPEHGEDYRAWDAAATYRGQQTWPQL